MAAARLLQRSLLVVAQLLGRTSWNAGPREKVKTVTDLPHVSVLKLLYRLMFQGFYSRLHELQLYEKQLYGPIYRDGLKTVSLTTPKLLEELLRSDEKFPSRGDMSFWKDYRDMKGFGYGPFTEEGERWYKLRKALNKRMMHPKDSILYGRILNTVVNDFIARLQYVRQCSPTGDLVKNLADEFYCFSLESIATILFETRLGALEKDVPASTLQFIDAIGTMFSNSLAVVVLPKWSRNLLPYWGRYINGWDGIFTFAKPLIDKKLEDIKQRIDRNQDVEGEYLTYLLSNTTMDTKDVYGSIAELLLAGVDTTSNTLTWTLYLLSRCPQVQEKLYKEVSELKTVDGTPSTEEVTQMPYLRAVIKEALRMYPVVPLNARVMAEKSVVIGGYEFSKNTVFTFCHYAISHDEETFPEPFTFKPERWLRDGRERPNPFGSIPFGFGVRSCIGRRIAELEMYLVIFQIIRIFEIIPDPSVCEVKSLNRTVLVPDRPINLHFVDRVYKKVS
ncbi:sterol 26-hydroxylase, mitochondrial [Corythoichthys intestinalis]|uniref:sterol 26-hydroxylase, mitochondrial n=1 Tax=Corythoichthys intestinalis TaxID=161448 RepID=UPI0025A67B80|nr:sterol 26-hydroxylase, mitochondrial [Corythoichthys intestinalis]XP_061799394.1 sterol 26-hydroxylase, mitochondrial-like [Nerophis lumbriciformis]